jgi:hypothetical protein
MSKFVDLKFKRDHYHDGKLITAGTIRSMPKENVEFLTTPVEYEEADEEGVTRKKSYTIAELYVPKAAAPAAEVPAKKSK